jgi:hypothetical protein
VPPPYATLAAAKEAGAVTLNYGLFLNALINFLIVALAMFMVVKAANRLKRQEAAAPTAPTVQETLLMEIRDLLKRPDRSRFVGQRPLRMRHGFQFRHARSTPKWLRMITPWSAHGAGARLGKRGKVPSRER